MIERTNITKCILYSSSTPYSPDQEFYHVSYCIVLYYSRDFFYLKEGKRMNVCVRNRE